MSSSGSREVLEAARKRLASAKSQVSAASQHMKAVMASAQTMCDAADKEYKEAKAALEEAEKKYEVIDIDDDSGRQTTDEDNHAHDRENITEADLAWLGNYLVANRNQGG